MKIDCVSDLHGFYPKLEGGDLLIIAGDCIAFDSAIEWVDFFKWLKEQKYMDKILVGGNHDLFLENLHSKHEYDFIYLCDSGIKIKEIKFWGSPHSLFFSSVNPKYTSFMGTEEELNKKYDLIPDDIDILISHTPPNRFCDLNAESIHCGSISLAKVVERIKPKIIVCGHIHEQGGKNIYIGSHTHIYNCSYVNERYKPVHKITTIMY